MNKVEIHIRHQNGGGTGTAFSVNDSGLDALEVKDIIKEYVRRKGFTINNDCEKCELLIDLYKSTEQTPRDYWLMTELFVMLHGSDICKKC